MDITVEELKEKINNKDQFVFIDVRETYEYDESNLKATLIPLGELMNRLNEITTDKDAEIVVHCRSGQRSNMAKSLLISQGYTNVRNLLGGIMEWHAKFGK